MDQICKYEDTNKAQMSKGTKKNGGKKEVLALNSGISLATSSKDRRWECFQSHNFRREPVHTHETDVKEHEAA